MKIRSFFPFIYVSIAVFLLISKNTNSQAVKIPYDVSSKTDWEKSRNRIIDNMQLVMGPLPEPSKKVQSDYIVTEDSLIDGIRLLKISFAAEKDDRVPAILMIPQEIDSPVPGILCLHQTIACGKEEPAGLCGNPDLHYALELAKRGYVTLSPDYPNFGEYSFDPYDNGYVSATMKGIRNHMAAVDLLQSLQEVDPGRIGCIGHSLGGHNTLFLAAFDKRIKVAVTSCGFTSFYRYYGGDLTGWSHKGYMPRIAEVYDRDPSKMPFDFNDVLAAIAPRPVFINAPLKDSNFEVEGVYDCVNSAKTVYNLLKASGKLIMMNPDAEHSFPPEIRNSAYLFIDKELKFRSKH